MVCYILCGLFLATICSIPASVRGQSVSFPEVRLRSHGPAGSYGAGERIRRPAAEHYDVVALRVEFQPDTTRFTTGDGTFASALFDTLRPNLDPLPHDAAYFQAHLDFLEDYVATVSDGKTRITPHLIPEVVRLSQKMAVYSPTGVASDSDAELRKLAAFVEEAWRTASENVAFDASGLDPEHTAFVLFHAGVGRDLELTGTTLDRTPEDLPSLFFDSRALDRLLPGSSFSFKGLPVGHTMIVPRTETRRGFNFITDEPFLAEFSINGILAANFFSFLRAPDLFDTATGQSAIGPFGLMDPLGIFAYAGLFPPEPSAWTKYYLGWTDPLEVADDGPVSVQLRAAVDQAGSDAALIPVSGAEYFLVENRNRDPEGDGLVMRIWKEGNITEQRVQNGDEQFNSFTQEGFAGGVVVGIDNYDWALPGGIGEDGSILNGGILIWHIDERRLVARLAENRVNADPERRAVDLEEADGAQDLGFPSGSDFGPQADLGSPFDYFYKGNPVSVETLGGRIIRLYQNRFGPDTNPNSATNEGGVSFVVLEEFSEPGAVMSFVYRRQDAEAGIRPLTVANPLYGEEVRFSRGSSISVHGGAGSQPARLVVYAAAVDEGGSGKASGLYLDGSGETDSPSSIKPAVSDRAEAYLYRQMEPPGGWEIAVDRRQENGAYTREVMPLPNTLDLLTPVSPLVSVDRQGGKFWCALFAAPGAGAQVACVDEDLQTQITPVPDVGGDVSFSVVEGNRLVVAGSQATRVIDGPEAWTYSIPEGTGVGQAAFGNDRGGLTGVLPVKEKGELLFLLPGGEVQRIDVAAHAGNGGAFGLSAYPVLADLDADGYLDALATYDSTLVAFTQGAAVVRGFPVRLTAPSVSQPLVARLTDSGAWSVLVAGTDGYVHGYDLGARGEPVAGFPLAVGLRIAGTPALNDGKLFAVSEDGVLKAWELEKLNEIAWGELYGEGRNHSYAKVAANPNPSPGGGLLVEEETYNWPNPVRNGETYLRCMTREDSRIRITIIDSGGALIDQIHIDGVRGNTPVEHLWQTNAPSGLYYVRVTATSDSGQTQTKLVKLAILR